MVVDAVSATDPEAVTEFRDKVYRLAVSPSWLNRRISMTIMDNCNWPHPAPTQIVRPLPNVYHSSAPAVQRELALPSGVDYRPEATDKSRNSNNWLAPFDLDLEAIASVAHVPVNRLRERRHRVDA